MIFDPKIEILCDGCKAESVFYEMEFVYRDYGGKSGYYDDDECKIERFLKREGWVLRGGNHYCCERCAAKGGAA
jgi:hypothetical protein